MNIQVIPAVIFGNNVSYVMLNTAFLDRGNLRCNWSVGLAGADGINVATITLGLSGEEFEEWYFSETSPDLDEITLTKLGLTRFTSQ